jgi:hypothetical protein
MMDIAYTKMAATKPELNSNRKLETLTGIGDNSHAFGRREMINDLRTSDSFIANGTSDIWGGDWTRVPEISLDRSHALLDGISGHDSFRRGLIV